MTETKVYIIVLLVFLVALGPDLLALIKLVEKPTIAFSLEHHLVRVHSIALGCALVLSVIMITFEVNIFNYSTPLEYRDHTQISLKDFNGFRLPGQSVQGMSEFAFITTSIEYKIKEDRIQIENYFHPARSYVYIDDLENDDLLTHEMYHFHISEIWARTFRREVKQGKLKSNRDLNRLYENIFRSERQMQAQYDYDTDHSYLLGNQLEWQRKVDSVLLNLDSYRGTEILF